MQPIGRHISELLFDHDCVIVPALGGFLASNESARMMPNRVIYPPYRRLAFNVYLKQNDGLLANRLVEAENITYASANSILEEFTYECIQNLEHGKKVSIDQVGTLYFDREKNIQFEAYRNINHRKDSFGMEPVQIVPVQHSQDEIRKPVSVRPAKSIRPSKEPKPQRFSSRGKRIIGVAAVLAAIAWFGTSLYLSTPKKYEASSVIPFDSQASVIPIGPSKDTSPANISDSQSSQLASADTQATGSQITDTQASQQDTTQLAVNLSPSKGDVNTPIEPPKPAVVTPPVSSPVTSTINDQPAQTGPRRYMVAGVFKIRENAITMQARLLSAGFPNAKIIESNGLNYVSYSEVNTTEEAIALIDSLKKNNMEGWVWKH